jgi:outer membrane protein assembly factor BamD
LKNSAPAEALRPFGAVPAARSGRRTPGGAAIAFGFALLVALGQTGCDPVPSKPKGAIDYTENAKRDYDRAMRALNDKNWETVEGLFNDVRKNYSYSRYARLAELRIADANYQQDKLPEAISGYKAFIHDYPNDPEVPYARYQIAKGEYDSVSVSMFLPPLEERDLASVNDALATIRGFLGDYPNSEHSEQLRYMMEVVLGLLARHELYVARYYLAKDNFIAASARVDRAATAFPNSGLEAEALLVLAEIRMKEKRLDEARAALHRLLKEHPESPFSVSARNYLARLDAGEPVSVLRQGQTQEIKR